MRAAISFLYCLFLLSAPSIAQEKKFKGKFGKITPEELSMKYYEADTAAPAVVIFDRAEFYHIGGSNGYFSYEMTRHIRIKIFNKSAYNLAIVSILHNFDEAIKDLRASSYNEENGVLVETKLEKENAVDEKLTREIFQKKFTLPSVREGSIIEYKYTRSNMFATVPDWYFQDPNLPTIWSEYKASVPSFIEYRLIKQGEVPFSLSKMEEKTNLGNGYTYTSQEMHFIQEHIPALKPEPFMTSVSDYRSQITFDIRAIYERILTATGSAPGSYRLTNGRQLEKRSTWKNIGQELLEDVYEEPIQSTKYTASETATQIEGKHQTAEKVAALYAFIGKNYETRYLDMIWMSQSLADLTRTRKGTPTELNILLINMLQRAKIKAFPVASSTIKNGQVLPYRVTMAAFDRILTAIENEDKTISIIDASAWPHPVGFLPEEDLNNAGLMIVSKDSVIWVALENKARTRTAIQAELQLDPDGKLSGDMQLSQAGYGAIEARSEITDEKKGALPYLKDAFSGLFSEGDANNLKIENFDNWQDPNLKWRFSYESNGSANGAGNKIYLTPSLGMGYKENPFKNPVRKFNIEFGYPYATIYDFNIKIPKGYTVEEKPKSIKLLFGENALIFEYYIETTPETIKVTIRTNIRETYIPVEHYADLQHFFGQIVSKLEEQLVLTKI